MEKITRRNVIASGLGLMMSGYMLENVKADEQTEQSGEECWKYVPLDPQKAGQRVYETFGTSGCQYGAFKGVLMEYAATVEKSDPTTAAAVRAFPFVSLRCGRSGFAKLKQLCGAVAGGVMFFSCFVKDFPDACKLAEELGAYAAETALPEFIPEKDEHPDFLKVVSHGLTCKEMGGAWMKVANDEQKKIVGERCKRHTASIMVKAVNLLNDYFA